MCQILCLTSHDPARLHEIIQKVWVSMAFSQKDGYGAAWRGADGTIGYLKRRFPKISTEAAPPFVKPTAPTGYGSHKPQDPFFESNDIPSDGGFLIIHGRTATNAVNMANTHPFLDVLDDGRLVAMVHNGVVSSSKYSNLLDGCTCDSELLLRAYTSGGIDEVERHIDGRYAFMYLEVAPPTVEEVAAAAEKGIQAVGKTTLHVAKDEMASLYCGVKLDDTFVFATTEHLIKLVDGEPEGEVRENMLMVFSDKTTVVHTPYKGLTYADRLKDWWHGNDKPKTTESYPPVSQGPTQHQTRQAIPYKPSALDKDLSDEELAEIRRLEMEPIEMVGAGS